MSSTKLGQDTPVRLAGIGGLNTIPQNQNYPFSGTYGNPRPGENKKEAFHGGEKLVVGGLIGGPQSSKRKGKDLVLVPDHNPILVNLEQLQAVWICAISLGGTDLNSPIGAAIPLPRVRTGIFPLLEAETQAAPIPF